MTWELITPRLIRRGAYSVVKWTDEPRPFDVPEPCYTAWFREANSGVRLGFFPTADDAKAACLRHEKGRA